MACLAGVQWVLSCLLWRIAPGMTIVRSTGTVMMRISGASLPGTRYAHSVHWALVTVRHRYTAHSASRASSRTGRCAFGCSPPRPSPTALPERQKKQSAGETSNGERKAHCSLTPRVPAAGRCLRSAALAIAAAPRRVHSHLDAHVHAPGRLSFAGALGAAAAGAASG